MEAKIVKAFMCWKKFGDDEKKKTAEIAMEVNKHERSKSFLNALKILTEDGQLEKDGGTYGLLEKGVAAAVEMFGEELGKPMTNEDFQAQVKSSLKLKYAPIIFDLLLTQGPNTRKELARIAGVNERSHVFSYGLQELTKKRGLVGPDSGNTKGSSQLLCLTDKAFLKGGKGKGERKGTDKRVQIGAVDFVAETASPNGSDQDLDQENVVDMTTEATFEAPFEPEEVVKVPKVEPSMTFELDNAAENGAKVTTFETTANFRDDLRVIHDSP
jgi:hypothetical protein